MLSFAAMDGSVGAALGRRIRLAQGVEEAGTTGTLSAWNQMRPHLFVPREVQPIRTHIAIVATTVLPHCRLLAQRGVGG